VWPGDVHQHHTAARPVRFVENFDLGEEDFVVAIGIKVSSNENWLFVGLTLTFFFSKHFQATFAILIIGAL
jgi:hypothetical protein